MVCLPIWSVLSILRCHLLFPAPTGCKLCQLQICFLQCRAFANWQSVRQPERPRHTARVSIANETKVLQTSWTDYRASAKFWFRVRSGLLSGWGGNRKIPFSPCLDHAYPLVYGACTLVCVLYEFRWEAFPPKARKWRFQEYLARSVEG